MESWSELVLLDTVSCITKVVLKASPAVVGLEAYKASATTVGED